MMQALLQIIFGTSRATAPGLPFTLPKPDRPICLIGDVHGRYDLLQNLLAVFETQPGAAQGRLIFLGDMIDRGPNSAAVLDRLHHLAGTAPSRVICLMGNHERMLLDFLDQPDRKGLLWLHNGGAETLTSFGVALRVPEGAAALNFSAIATQLRAALPPGLETWLRELPLSWQEGQVAATHAGADPALPIEKQTEQVLLWGHRDFARIPRHDGIWVVHGHVIFDRAWIAPGRIAVDTGAWHSGRLSAAWLDGQGLRFLEVTG